MKDNVSIKANYLKHQVPFINLLEDPFKYFMFPKGRRYGFTHAMMIKAFVWMSKGVSPILWGDVTNPNIDRYVDRYMMPLLKPIPSSEWNWNKQKKELNIFGSVCDFRSAERPENWEGFGYKKIILNEAGIILKNRDLYNNSVLPMLLDFPESQLIAGGTPKGQTYKGEDHLFYELCERAKIDPSYLFYHATTYDNTKLKKEDIQQLEDQFDQITAQQELYGQFIDKTGMMALYCFDEKEHVAETTFNENRRLYLSFDFNINPFVCLISQQWEDPITGKKYKHFLEEIYLTPDQIGRKTHIEAMCDIIITKYGRSTDFMITGDATQNKGELTQKLKVNAWTQIKSYLKCPPSNFKLPTHNPSVGRSLEQCNAMFSKPHLVEIRISPKCKELIRDFKGVKITDTGDIDKTNSKRSHLLDAYRYDCNTWDKDFLRLI